MLFLSLVTMLAAPPADTAGVYLTAAAFEHRHLAYVTTAHHLHLSFPPGLKMALLVQTPTGQRQRFTAGSIYGYRKHGTDYRYISPETGVPSETARTYYAVAALTPLCLYTHPQAGYRSAVTVWYYSLTASGNLRRLTPANLAQDFPSQPALAHAVATTRALHRNMGAVDKADGQLQIVKLLTAYLK